MGLPAVAEESADQGEQVVLQPEHLPVQRGEIQKTTGLGDPRAVHLLVLEVIVRVGAGFLAGVRDHPVLLLGHEAVPAKSTRD